MAFWISSENALPGVPPNWLFVSLFHPSSRSISNPFSSIFSPIILLFVSMYHIFYVRKELLIKETS